MCLVSLHFVCAVRTWHCLAGYFFHPSPPATILSSLCLLKSLVCLSGVFCLGPIGVGCFSSIAIHQNWIPLDSKLLISRTLLLHLGSSCTLFFGGFYYFIHKNALKSAQFSSHIWPLATFPQNSIVTDLLVCLPSQWRSWLRHSATSRKVAGSIPVGVIGIFYCHNLSGCSMALG